MHFINNKYTLYNEEVNDNIVKNILYQDCAQYKRETITNTISKPTKAIPGVQYNKDYSNQCA